MRDRRVGEHALHVGLHHRGDRSDEQRQHREPEDRGAPVDLVDAERADEDAQDRGERGGLGRRRHERGHRGGRALVHVGRPHVERRGRDLEAEADQQQGEADEQHAVVEEHDAREELRDAGEVRGAGGAVDERDAVEEDGRREGAEQEVLEPGLLRGEALAVERGEHVQRDREDLERQEDGDEVVGRRHQHHAGGRAQHQREVLGALEVLAPQVAAGQQQREQGGAEDHRLHEHREPVDRDQPAQGLVRTVAVDEAPLHAGEDARRSPHPRSR